MCFMSVLIYECCVLCNVRAFLCSCENMLKFEDGFSCKTRSPLLQGVSPHKTRRRQCPQVTVQGQLEIIEPDQN